MTVTLDSSKGIPKLRLVCGHAQFVDYQLFFVSPEGYQGATISKDEVSKEEIQNGYSLADLIDSVDELHGQKLRWKIVVSSPSGEEGELYSIKLDLIQTDNGGELEHRVTYQNGSLPVEPLRGEREITVQ